MVVSGKVFRSSKPTSLSEVALKLNGYKVPVEPPQGAPEGIQFYSEVRQLAVQDNRLRGVYSYDDLIFVDFHGKEVGVPITRDAPFEFVQSPTGLYLIVVAKKWRANSVSRRLNDVIYVTREIRPISVDPAAMAKLVEERTENQVVTFFDNLNLNVDKLSLYGQSLPETGVYRQYASSGGIWYTVARSKRFGYVVGLGRNGVVVGFGLKDPEKFFEYVREEVLPALPSGLQGDRAGEQRARHSASSRTSDPESQDKGRGVAGRIRPSPRPRGILGTEGCDTTLATRSACR